MISRDQGETWSALGNVPGRLAGEIHIDPGNPNNVLVGTEEGVFLSKNGGGGFSQCRGVAGTAIAFHVDQTSPPETRTIFAATSRGVWRSTDGGETWQEKTDGLPSREILSFSGGSNRDQKLCIIYCSVPGRNENGSYAGGIYRSLDKGDRWESAMGAGINKDIRSADQYAEGQVAQYPYVFSSNRNPRVVIGMNRSTGFWPPHNPNVCLLYTSPSPRDRTRSRMPSSA